MNRYILLAIIILALLILACRASTGVMTNSEIVEWAAETPIP